MPHSSNTWPQTTLSNGRARPPLLPGGWPSRFDPFASSERFGWTAPLPTINSYRPPINLPVPHAERLERTPLNDNHASPEHISSMLRSLGITPSPGASPAPAPTPGDHSPSSITPPALSPTTQIMSLGSSSSIHTPTLARSGEPLFTPTSSLFDHSLLFSETPKARPSLVTDSDEIVFQPTKPRSRKSTGGATNLSSHQPGPIGSLAPRHAALANAKTQFLPSPVSSHERVMSWMQRQALSPSSSFGSGAGPHQDWVFGSPQVAVAVPSVAPVLAPAVPQFAPQPTPQLAGTAASTWAPRPPMPTNSGFVCHEDRRMPEPALNEPINFLRLLQPSSQPPYGLFVSRIVKNSDQQASIFLQQKLKAATSEEARRPIIDAIVEQGLEMMVNRFGNWAIQRCLEAPCTMAERARITDVMKGRVIELATNCYGTHVVQKALDCTEDIQLFVVAEMLQGDLSATLMNKHASHVWTKIMELSWNDPAPPIFDYVNKAMQGRWADLARHETGSLIVQHAFENLEEADKVDCVCEVIESIGTLATDQWGSWVVQHLLENGTENDRAQAVSALVEHLSALSADPQGVKAIEKAIKSGGAQAVDKIVRRLSEPAKGARRSMVVDLALGSSGSQLLNMLLPLLSKAQWVLLYDSVKGHTVTLKGSKSGSRVVWLFERTKAQHAN